MFSLSNKKHIRVFQVYTKTQPCFLFSFQYTYVFSRFCPKTQARFCLEKKNTCAFSIHLKIRNTKKHKKNTKKHIPFLRRSTSNLEDKARSNRAINLCPCRFGCSIQCHGPIAKKRGRKRRCKSKFTKTRPLSQTQSSCTNSIPKFELVPRYHENMPKKVNFANFFITYFYLCTKIC